MHTGRFIAACAAALALNFVCSGCACGTAPSRHFEQLVAAEQTFARVYLIKKAGAAFAKSGTTGAIVDSADCKVSGKVEIDDTGLARFLDCKMTPDQTLRGGVLANDQGFTYQNLVQEQGGRLSTINGGYTWQNPTTLVVNITLTYPDFDDGPTVTAHGRGTLTIVDDKASGTLTYVTDKDAAAGRQGSTCTYKEVSLETLAAFNSDTGAFGDICSDEWALTSGCLGAAQHLCEKLPSQGCSPATMETAVNRIKNECGTKFDVSAAANYCSFFSGSNLYRADLCVETGH